MEVVHRYLRSFSLLAILLLGLSANASNFQIFRPLNYEVISLHESLLKVQVFADHNSPVKIDILGNGVILQSETATIKPPESMIYLKLNERVRDWRDGWLKLIVKKDAEQRSVNFGLGYLFFTAGQSNSANWQCMNCLPILPKPETDQVVFLNDSTVVPEGKQRKVMIKPVASFSNLSFVNNQIRSPLADGHRQNVWYPLGVKLTKKYRVPVAFISVGIGGSHISRWNNEAGLFRRFSYGKGFRPTAVLWHQGESDNDDNTPGPIYKSLLKNLIQKVRATWNFEVPWFIAIASKCRGQAAQRIVAAQTEVIEDESIKDVYAGPNTDGIRHLCHFDTQEQLSQLADLWLYSLERSHLLSQ